MANLMRRNRGQDVAPTFGGLEWEPFRLMRDLMGFDPLRGGEWPARQLEAFAPRFDIKETKESYVFKADLPGVKEEDLDISLTGTRLTISGRREGERQEEGETFHAYERSYGAFSRSFTLPDGVDGEHVTAELKNGELLLVVPKKPEVQPRRIQIGGRDQGKLKA